MKNGLELMIGVDVFTLLGLFRKAAIDKGLEFHESIMSISSPIKMYELNNRLLTFLATRNIKRQDRPDCGNEIFTLIDENPQDKVPGWAPSNYWNFKLSEAKNMFDLQVMISVSFDLNLEKRGIVLIPKASGSFVSPTDLLSNFRMFKALVESDNNAPVVAKELAASDGSIVVLWTDLGLGGIRKLSHLFLEFAGENRAILELGRDGKIFNPSPNFHKSLDLNYERFITERAQPKLFQIWRTQLEEYRSSLLV